MRGVEDGACPGVFQPVLDVAGGLTDNLLIRPTLT